MSKQSEQPSLQTLMSEFDELLAWFRQEDLDVEVALKKFEEGSKLAEQIRERLASLENTITVLQQHVAEQ